jgi:hypothetical protein
MAAKERREREEWEQEFLRWFHGLIELVHGFGISFSV